jgi:HEAT repeat protein
MKTRRLSILWVLVLVAAGCGQSPTRRGGADAIGFWKQQAGNPRARVRALRALVKIGPPAVSALTDLFQQQDWTLRVSAAQAFGQMGKEAAPALIDLLEDRDNNVRICALGALANLGPEAREAAAAVIPLLGHPDLRLYAVDVLRRIGPEAKAAIPALERLRDDPDVDVRLWVAAALKAIDPQNAAFDTDRGPANASKDSPDKTIAGLTKAAELEHQGRARGSH